MSNYQPFHTMLTFLHNLVAKVQFRTPLLPCSIFDDSLIFSSWFSATSSDDGKRQQDSELARVLTTFSIVLLFLFCLTRKAPAVPCWMACAVSNCQCQLHRPTRSICTLCHLVTVSAKPQPLFWFISLQCFYLKNLEHLTLLFDVTSRH